MTRKVFCLLSFVIVLIVAIAAPAQQTPSPFPPKKDVSFYRLDFVMRELDDGKAVNTRSSSILMKADGVYATLKSGYDTPVTLNPNQGGSSNYRNVGFQLDCALDEIDNNPVATISASISDVLHPDQTNEAKPTPPVFRNIAFKSAALLTPGKPTTVSSIDDPNSKRRFQLEVTATKLK